MGFADLQQSLDQLAATQDSPVVVFEYRGLKFHLRDLDAGEDALANEYAYAEVEAATRSGIDPAQNFARSMRATFQFRLAYVALAIRRIEQGNHCWDVDVRPTEMVVVNGQRVEKFSHFLQMVAAWGSNLPVVIYEKLAEVREQRKKEVEAALYVEEAEEPPAQTVAEGSRFTPVGGEGTEEAMGGDPEYDNVMKLRRERGL